MEFYFFFFFLTPLSDNINIIQPLREREKKNEKFIVFGVTTILKHITVETIPSHYIRSGFKCDDQRRYDPERHFCPRGGKKK